MFEVCIDNLLEHTRKISSWERVTSTADELEAFKYIQKELETLGLRTTLYSHDAFVSIPLGASLSIDGERFVCQTHSMAVSAHELQAPLVLGGKAADLTKTVCAGNIVVINGRAEREPIIKAANLGAVGVVCVSGEYIYESCISPIWGSPSHKNRHLLPKIPAVSINNSTYEDIKNCLQRFGGQALATLNTAVDSDWKKQPLLVAEVPASIETDKFVMFSGHVDSWYHGAMDNGSTNATMMEVCRIAQANRDKLVHNLRVVFFSGHSQGRYSGSAWYFDNFWEDIHYNCIISVNADSLGAIGANDLTRSTIMPEVKPFAKQLIKELAGVDFVGRRYSRFADQSFWGTGVSCAFASFSKQILDGRQTVGKFAIPAGGSLDLGWWWHTPADTFDKIDPDNLARDAKIFANFVMHYATNKVVDLDFRESLDEIIGIIKDWQEKAADNFDLSMVQARAQLVRDKLEDLYKYKPCTTDCECEIEKFNKILWKIGRILVTINYTQGHNYQNDPAVAQPPMPALADINLLSAANERECKEILLELVRSRNYIMHSLKEVLDTLNLK